MGKIVHKPLALADLDGIWDYIAEDNPDSADKLLRSIETTCRTLADFPHLGGCAQDWREIYAVSQLAIT